MGSKMASPVKVRLGEFQMAIHETYNCEAQDTAEIVHVRVPRNRGRSWDGMVHIFEISGHPKATRCYVWPEVLDAKTVIIRAVLHSDKISSPQKAVQSVINRRRRA
jgi:hypothetical protein